VEQGERGKGKNNFKSRPKRIKKPRNEFTAKNGTHEERGKNQNVDRKKVPWYKSAGQMAGATSKRRGAHAKVPQKIP